MRSHVKRRGVSITTTHGYPTTNDSMFRPRPFPFNPPPRKLGETEPCNNSLLTMQCNCPRIINSCRGQSTLIRLRRFNFSTVRCDTKYNDPGARYLYIQTDDQQLPSRCLIETCFSITDPVWFEQFRGIANRPLPRRSQCSSTTGRPRSVLGRGSTIAAVFSGAPAQFPRDLLRALQHPVQNGRRVLQRVLSPSPRSGPPLRVLPSAPVHHQPVLSSSSTLQSRLRIADDPGVVFAASVSNHHVGVARQHCPESEAKACVVTIAAF